jgi:diacylglycerol kinase (ATP)
MSAVAEALRALGHEVEATPTRAAGSAAQQACEAAATAEVVFACGGDGTIHEALQGLVSEEGKPASALGVIPLGSANALARHLGLPLDPLAAALAQIRGEPRAIPVGKIHLAASVRYFAVMAGAGPDGALTYSLLASQKAAMGRLAYYVQAARLFATRRFPEFEVECIRAVGGAPQLYKAASVMAVRVGSLGGIFHGLTSPRASIHDAAMQIVILAPPAKISLPLWFLTGWIGAHRFNPFFRSIEASRIACRAIQDAEPLGKVHIQADGEWLGVLPFEASLVPNALRILLPARKG